MSSSSSYPLEQTRAFGKLILFGEHFVVHQAPALVGAVSAYTDCQFEYLSDQPGKLEVVDDRPAVPDYKIKKYDEGLKAINLTLAHLGVDTTKKGIKLTFGGDLCCASGIGASAAQVVSLARAVNLAENRKMTEDEINAAGYEGEKGYHGTPSGIDNTTSTFGGVLKFQRTENGSPIFEKKTLQSPIRIVYASTGITASTTQVVGDVRAKKEADEAWFANLMDQYQTLVQEGQDVLEQQKGDSESVTRLGELMNQNHTILQELTVSCSELDALVDAARAAGAVGAKMSGTGRGGLMIALTPTEEVQNTVAAALEKAGAPQVWKTTFA